MKGPRRCFGKSIVNERMRKTANERDLMHNIVVRREIPSMKGPMKQVKVSLEVVNHGLEVMNCTNEVVIKSIVERNASTKQRLKVIKCALILRLVHKWFETRRLMVQMRLWIVWKCTIWR